MTLNTETLSTKSATFSEENLKAGLHAFTSPTRSRYKNAISNFRTKLGAGADPVDAINETLEEAINESPQVEDPQDALNRAREAAGVTPTQRVHATSHPVVDQPIKPAESEVVDTEIVEVHTPNRFSDMDNRLITSTVVGAIIGFLLGILLTWGAKLLYVWWLGFDTGAWPGWVTIPVTTALFALIGYRFGIRSEIEKREEEVSDDTTFGSVEDLNLPTA